jgi:predicted nucleic acid-binding protein
VAGVDGPPQESSNDVYLLDTNIVSELRRPRPHGAVVAWLQGVADEDLYLSAVTLGELQAGVEVTREQDPDKAAAIEAWIDQVAQTWNVLSPDGRIFRSWAKLMHGQQDHLLADALIAATAIAHHLIVVTRNVKDFERFEVSPTSTLCGIKY